MNSPPSPYLKVTRRASSQRGMSSTSSCSTLTHSTGPMPSGKSKISGSLNGAVVYQPRSLSQITGGFRHSSIVVQMLKDGAKISRPASSCTTRFAPSRVPSSSTALNRWSSGVAGEHVAEPRLHAHADQREATGALPVPGLGELVVAELDPGLLVRVQRMRLGQAHRHVQVVRPGGQGAREDGRHELRLDRIHHVSRPMLARERGDAVRIRCVDPGRDEPSRPADRATFDPVDGALGAGRVVVADDHGLEEVASGGDLRDRVTDAAGADQTESSWDTGSFGSS